MLLTFKYSLKCLKTLKIILKVYQNQIYLKHTIHHPSCAWSPMSNNSNLTYHISFQHIKPIRKLNNPICLTWNHYLGGTHFSIIYLLFNFTPHKDTLISSISLHKVTALVGPTFHKISPLQPFPHEATSFFITKNFNTNTSFNGGHHDPSRGSLQLFLLNPGRWLQLLL